jgi:hypothetical protein
MTKYACIENNEITSILDYQPNVPNTIEVIEITNEEYSLLVEKTHYFDVETKAVKATSAEIVQQQQLEKNRVEYKTFLNTSDWKVLRHIREKALGLETSMSEEEYLELESKRHELSKSI